MSYNGIINYNLLATALIILVLFGCFDNKKLCDQKIAAVAKKNIIISKANIFWFNSPLPNRDSGFEVNIVCQKLKTLVLDSLHVNGRSFPIKLYINRNFNKSGYEDQEQAIISSFLNFPKNEHIKMGSLFFHKGNRTYIQRITFEKSENLNPPQ
jgi:hypothetical protein